MQVLAFPRNLFELSETVGLVAVEPRVYQLDGEGNLVSKPWAANSEQITALFSRLVDCFKHLAERENGDPSSLKKCLTGLRVIASQEISGKAAQVLQHWKDPAVIPAAKEDIPVHLKLSEYNKMLSFMYYERVVVQNGLKAFIASRRVLEIDKEIFNLGGTFTEIGKRGCFSYDLSKVSSYVFSAIIRHSDVIEKNEFRTEVSKSLGLIAELQDMQNKGLLQEGDITYLTQLQLTQKREDCHHVLDTRPFIQELKKLLSSFLEERGMYGGQMPTSSFLCRFFMNMDPSERNYDRNTFSEEESRLFFEEAYNYLKNQKATFQKYHSLYQGLKASTKKCSTFAYRRLYSSPEKMIPAANEFGYSWEFSCPPSKKQVRVRPKKNKASAKPRKKSGANKLRRKESPEVVKVHVEPPVAPLADKIMYADRVKAFLGVESPGKTRDEIEHGFGLAVDGFVKQLGIQTKWKETGLLYSIPGEIEYHGNVHRGIYTFCFDSASPDYCYHRCFMRKPADDMVAEYQQKGYWEFDFPELALPEEVKNEKGSAAEDGSRVVVNNQYVVEIDDPINRATIRLFKVKR